MPEEKTVQPEAAPVATPAKRKKLGVMQIDFSKINAKPPKPSYFKIYRRPVKELLRSKF